MYPNLVLFSIPKNFGFFYEQSLILFPYRNETYHVWKIIHKKKMVKWNFCASEKNEKLYEKGCHPFGLIVVRYTPKTFCIIILKNLASPYFHTKPEFLNSNGLVKINSVVLVAINKTKWKSTRVLSERDVVARRSYFVYTNRQFLVWAFFRIVPSS